MSERKDYFKGTESGPVRVTDPIKTPQLPEKDTIDELTRTTREQIQTPLPTQEEWKDGPQYD